MANSFFRFKQFTIQQDGCAMKVTTDACLFGAWCAAEIKNEKRAIKRLLDIGTGTGLLSLMIAQQCAVAIDAVEIDAVAAAQAKANVALSPYAQNITIINNDILQVTSGNYDGIVCNPPFYEGDLASPDKTKNVAHHSRGLTWKALFHTINRKLKEDGFFFLLLPYKRKSDMEGLAKEGGLYIHQSVQVQQSSKHAYFRLMVMGSKRGREETEMGDFSICDDHRQYTPAFIQLLKEYYLYL